MQISELSGGELQLAALIRALGVIGGRTSILLVDEPTSALDASTTARVEECLMDWLSQRPRAIVWITHDEQQADRLATRRIHLEAGRVTVDD